MRGYVLVTIPFVYMILVKDCFNGEQNGLEGGVDCGGHCEMDCASESSRAISWLR